MRRIIGVFLFAPLAALCFGQAMFRAQNVTPAGGGNGGTVTKVNNLECSPNASSNCTITATTSGSSLVVAVYLTTSTPTVTGCTTSASQSLTQVTAFRAHDASGGAVDLWYIHNATAGTTFVNCTSSSGNRGHAVWEIAGLANAAPDQVGTPKNDQGATTTPTSPSVTITVGKQFFVALLAEAVSCVSNTTPWLTDATISGTCFDSRITTTTGSISDSWTTASGSYASNIASFKATGAN